jgi:hypothetical protein
MNTGIYEEISQIFMYATPFINISKYYNTNSLFLAQLSNPSIFLFIAIYNITFHSNLYGAEIVMVSHPKNELQLIKLIT